MRRTRALTFRLAAIAVLLGHTAAEAKSPPSPVLPCPLAGADAATYLSLDSLPTPVKRLLATQIGNGQTIDMVPRDADYQETDLITSPDGPLSFHRFIQAGHAGARWYVWYQSGGEGSRYDYIIDEWRHGDDEACEIVSHDVWVDELCEETKAHLNDPPIKTGG